MLLYHLIDSLHQADDIVQCDDYFLIVGDAVTGECAARVCPIEFFDFLRVSDRGGFLGELYKKYFKFFFYTIKKGLV